MIFRAIGDHTQKFSSFGRKKQNRPKIRHRMVMLRCLHLMKTENLENWRLDKFRWKDLDLRQFRQVRHFCQICHFHQIHHFRCTHPFSSFARILNSHQIHHFHQIRHFCQIHHFRCTHYLKGLCHGDFADFWP